MRWLMTIWWPFVCENRAKASSGGREGRERGLPVNSASAEEPSTVTLGGTHMRHTHAAHIETRSSGLHEWMHTTCPGGL